MVLPGAHTWSPFEEGILHLWGGGGVCPPVGLQKNCETACVQPVGLPNVRGETIVPVREWDRRPAAHKCSFCPLATPTPAPGSAPHKVFPNTMKSGRCSPPHPMWEMQHRVTGSDHQVCPIGAVRSMFGRFASCFRPCCNVGMEPRVGRATEAKQHHTSHRDVFTIRPYRSDWKKIAIRKGI